MKAKAIRFFSVTGMRWGIPLVKILSGEDLRQHLIHLVKTVLVPFIAIVSFLLLWSVGARQIETSLGVVPGPSMVWNQAKELWQQHLIERAKAKEFYQRQEARNAQKLAKDPNAKVHIVEYTGKATYVDQIFTSLKTVFLGFVIASLIALPIGIIGGLSKTFMKAINPLVQIFKPVSPLAWLPLVTMIISAVYATNNGW